MFTIRPVINSAEVIKKADKIPFFKIPSSVKYAAVKFIKQKHIPPKMSIEGCVKPLHNISKSPYPRPPIINKIMFFTKITCIYDNQNIDFIYDLF